MKALTVEEMRRAVHGRWMSPSNAVTLTGVSTDTRTACPGDLFIALRGERFDAHGFLGDAADAGCVAAVVCRDAPLDADVAARFGGGLIGVADTTEALGELAAYHRKQSSATVVAVTGSNGKTTVKRMIDHVLAQRYTGTCSPKSFNNEIGVPLTFLAAEAGDDYVVCELGSNAPGEIAALARIARPDIAVITSVSATHLAHLGSIEQVAVEKASILAGLAAGGVAVVVADSGALERALRAYDEARLIRFGLSDAAALRVTAYEPTGDGLRMEVNGHSWARLGLLGRHNAVNALAAVAVAQRFGFTQADALAALADFAPIEMRLQPVDVGGVRAINDAYNANPASVLAAAEALIDAGGKRTVLIVGDMLELGDQAEKLHIQTGREIAERGIDLLIGVGPLGRYIATGAAEAGLAAERFDSLADASEGVAGLLRRGDTVLIKGSRATAMERLIPAIERATARGAKRARKPKKGSKR